MPCGPAHKTSHHTLCTVVQTAPAATLPGRSPAGHAKAKSPCAAAARALAELRSDASTICENYTNFRRGLLAMDRHATHAARPLHHRLHKLFRIGPDAPRNLCTARDERRPLRRISMRAHRAVGSSIAVGILLPFLRETASPMPLPAPL